MKIVSIDALKKFDVNADSAIKRSELAKIDTDGIKGLSTAELNAAGIDAADHDMVRQIYQTHENDPNKVLFKIQDLRSAKNIFDFINNNFKKLDTDGDGWISATDLEKIYNSSTFTTDAEREMLDTLIAHIEDLEEYSNDEWFDENDGITLEDAKAFMNEALANPEDPTINKITRWTINPAYNIARQMTDFVKNNFSKLDTDKDGWISSENLEDALKSGNFTSSSDREMIIKLKSCIEDLEEYSNDEWGDENDGITLKDMEAFVHEAAKNPNDAIIEQITRKTGKNINRSVVNLPTNVYNTIINLNWQKITAKEAITIINEISKGGVTLAESDLLDEIIDGDWKFTAYEAGSTNNKTIWFNMTSQGIEELKKFRDAQIQSSRLDASKAINTSIPDTATKDGILSPRAKAIEILNKMGDDLTALKGLEKMILEKKLTTAMIDQLYKIATELRHDDFATHGISGKDLLTETIDMIANPGMTIRQGWGKGTCGACTMQYLFVLKEPEKALKILEGLTSKQGKATLENGSEFVLPRNSIPGDNSGRTHVDRLFQSAIMNDASLFSWLASYDNPSDDGGFWAVIGGDSAISLSGFADLYSRLKGSEYTSVSCYMYGESDVGEKIQQAIKNGEEVPVLSTFGWNKVLGIIIPIISSVPNLHWLTVKNIKYDTDGKPVNVILRNPQVEDTGGSNPNRTGRGDNIIEMPYSEFLKILDGAVMPQNK